MAPATVVCQLDLLLLTFTSADLAPLLSQWSPTPLTVRPSEPAKSFKRKLITDHYIASSADDLLGVAAEATDAELKKAYKLKVGELPQSQLISEARHPGLTSAHAFSNFRRCNTTRTRTLVRLVGHSIASGACRSAEELTSVGDFDLAERRRPRRRARQVSRDRPGLRHPL